MTYLERRLWTACNKRTGALGGNLASEYIPYCGSPSKQYIKDKVFVNGIHIIYRHDKTWYKVVIYRGYS